MKSALLVLFKLPFRILALPIVILLFGGTIGLFLILFFYLDGLIMVEPLEKLEYIYYGMMMNPHKQWIIVLIHSQL